jgi:hypothetical protein
VPKLISEIVSGQSAEKTSNNGSPSDSYVRSFRIILNEPGESYDIESAVGVRVGDLHPVSLSPCESISERPDGDSRVVRLVTVTYKTTATDKKDEDPTTRPATFTISSSLMDVPATKWKLLLPDGLGGGLQAETDTLNPVLDRYEGISRLVPIVTISIEQFDLAPTSRLEDSGKVNGDDIRFLALQMPKYTCMLRSVNVRPHVETFGQQGLFRGFMRTFEFAYKPSGWWHDQIVEGWNIKNQNLNGNLVFNSGLFLEHILGKVKEPIALAAGTNNKKVRAVVPLVSPDSGWLQRPSAMPVALNADGTPRDVEAAKAAAVTPVLTERYVIHDVVDFGANFGNMGVRIRDII